MTHDPSSLEAELRKLTAAMPDEALLARLEAAADGTLNQLTPAEVRFEEFLRGNPPSKLAPDFLADLEKITRGVPFPTDGNIVPFPNKTSHPEVRRKRPMWAAAAAVALVGAASALLVPTGKPAGNLVEKAAPSDAAPANLVPASFNRGVTEVSDQGVVWKSGNQPHSVVRVVYQDRITLTDASGRTFEVEQPKVKYMLVPEKTD
jgi:hypothetical protein